MLKARREARHHPPEWGDCLPRARAARIRRPQWLRLDAARLYVIICVFVGYIGTSA